MSNAFFSDLLSTVTERGRNLLGLSGAPTDPEARAGNLIDACRDVLSRRGEASGTAMASRVLDHYASLDVAGRMAFFKALARDFGPDQKRLSAAVTRWQANPSTASAADIHYHSEPQRQELFRRLNRAPGGTAALVGMRADLIDHGRKDRELADVDRDFAHLFGSWFNRGFLVLRRIDWSAPAIVLEKIIRYEAVHEIRDWDDLRRRIDPADRRCYAFFHPALIDEPLIFVEVALTEAIPTAIAPLLAGDRMIVSPQKARTAVFYSISNCQRGLAGVSFGNFLIKQVVEELRRELPKLENFVTLSPVPDFMKWLNRAAATSTNPDAPPVMEGLHDKDWPQDAEAAEKLRKNLEPTAAHYFLNARSKDGRVVDAVARFHLGNGARLERINWQGDVSAKGLRESASIMVNYLYDLDEIERNHEAFANNSEVMASAAVRRMLKGDRARLAIMPANEAATQPALAAPGPDAAQSETKAESQA